MLLINLSSNIYSECLLCSTLIGPARNFKYIPIFTQREVLTFLREISCIHWIHQKEYE